MNEYFLSVSYSYYRLARSTNGSRVRRNQNLHGKLLNNERLDRLAVSERLKMSNWKRHAGIILLGVDLTDHDHLNSRRRQKKINKIKEIKKRWNKIKISIILNRWAAARGQLGSAWERHWAMHLSGSIRKK